MNSIPVRLVHITTVPQTLFFLRGQAAFFHSNGFEVHAISSPGEDLRRFGDEECVGVHAVPMRRVIAPLHDVVSLCRLWRRFRLLKPDIVHAHTPKAGLLAMLAAALAHVPGRIYHIHGLPLLTSRGLRRLLLGWSDRLACRLAHRVLCVSQSIRELAIAEGLVSAARIEVLGKGSINGVDAEGRFRHSPEVTTAAMQVRRKWKIPTDARVVGFVGRLVREKGVEEVAKAWTVLRQTFPDAHLVMVGGEELHDVVGPEVLRGLREDPRAHLPGHDWETPPLYATMSVLALPTYREGFVVTALEAAAMEVPVVVSNVPGCIDAVVDGETGTLVPVNDWRAVYRAVARYLRDPQLRRCHGVQARERVLRDYRPRLLWEELLLAYRGVLRPTTFTNSPIQRMRKLS